MTFPYTTTVRVPPDYVSGRCCICSVTTSRFVRVTADRDNHKTSATMNVSLCDECGNAARDLRRLQWKYQAKAIRVFGPSVFAISLLAMILSFVALPIGLFAFVAVGWLLVVIVLLLLAITGIIKPDVRDVTDGFVHFSDALRLAWDRRASEWTLQVRASVPVDVDSLSIIGGYRCAFRNDDGTVLPQLSATDPGWLRMRWLSDSGNEQARASRSKVRQLSIAEREGNIDVLRYGTRNKAFQNLRRANLQLDAEVKNWVVLQKDEVVAQALRLIGERPAEEWEEAVMAHAKRRRFIAAAKTWRSMMNAVATQRRLASALSRSGDFADVCVCCGLPFLTDALQATSCQRCSTRSHRRCAQHRLQPENPAVGLMDGARRPEAELLSTLRLPNGSRCAACGHEVVARD